ncbi:MAG: DUF2997 domain-containing protein [Bacteroidia bacterium]|nr:DUF2997 domain-containing protein [Bacteroidia bacterium]MDW8135003.1 DUF2997 domain-containing protein [Bacteroidia bacterium]
MRLEEIEVTIDPSGKVAIRVQGVEGMGCVDLTADLEKALGGEIESRELTAEAYSQTHAQEELRRVQQRGR